MYPITKMLIDFLQKIIKIYYYIISWFYPSIVNTNGIRLRGTNPLNNNNIMSIEERINNTLDNFGSLYYTFDGKQRIVVIGDYQTAKKFYKLGRIRTYPYLGYVFDKLLKNCIGANHNQEWLQMKKPLATFFTTKYLSIHFDILLKRTRKWINKTFWNDQLVLKLNDLHLDKLTMHILSQIIYGELTDTELDELYELAQIHNELMKIMSHDMTLRIPLFYRHFDSQNKKLVDSFWLRWKKFNDTKRMGYLTDLTFFGIMLKSEIYQYEDKLYQTLYEIMLFNQDIMIDTFANLIWNISLHHDVKEKLYEECKDVNIGSMEQLSNLEYLTCVINESARLNPGITITFAETITESAVLNDYYFSRGTMISLDTQMINRDPKMWKNPHSFDPSRFNNHQTSNSLFNFHRFGLGPRKCLGNIFADYIIKMSIVSLLQRCDMEPVTPESKWEKRQTLPNISAFNMTNQIKFIIRK